MSDHKVSKAFNYYISSKRTIENVYNSARNCVRGLHTALYTKNSSITDDLERNHALQCNDLMIEFQFEKLNIEENLLKCVLEYKNFGRSSKMPNEVTSKKGKKTTSVLQRSKRGKRIRRRATKKAKGFTLLMKIYRSKQI